MVGGVRKDLTSQGPATLFLLGDVGAATSETGALGPQVAGGGGIDYALKSLWPKLTNFYATAIAKAEKATVTSVHPTFALALTYKFERQP